jgi:hypothetical protein
MEGFRDIGVVSGKTDATTVIFESPVLLKMKVSLEFHARLAVYSGLLGPFPRTAPGRGISDRTRQAIGRYGVRDKTTCLLCQSGTYPYMKNMNVPFIKPFRRGSVVSALILRNCLEQGFTLPPQFLVPFGIGTFDQVVYWMSTISVDPQ